LESYVRFFFSFLPPAGEVHVHFSFFSTRQVPLPFRFFFPFRSPSDEVGAGSICDPFFFFFKAALVSPTPLLFEKLVLFPLFFFLLKDTSTCLGLFSFFSTDSWDSASPPPPLFFFPRDAPPPPTPPCSFFTYSSFGSKCLGAPWETIGSTLSFFSFLPPPLDRRVALAFGQRFPVYFFLPPPFCRRFRNRQLFFSPFFFFAA